MVLQSEFSHIPPARSLDRNQHFALISIDLFPLLCLPIADMSSPPSTMKEAHIPPSRASSDIIVDKGIQTPPTAKEQDTALPDWKPSRRLYVAFLTLAVITLMVALDGTSLSVALPVRSSLS